MCPGMCNPCPTPVADLGVGRAAVEGVGGVGAVVPEVDAVVVGARVLGRRRQHLLQHHVVGVAVLAQAVVGEERRRLGILRIFDGDRFQSLLELAAPVAAPLGQGRSSL